MYDKRCHVHTGAYVTRLTKSRSNWELRREEKRGSRKGLFPFSLFHIFRFEGGASLDIFCLSMERRRRVKAVCGTIANFSWLPNSWPMVGIRYGSGSSCPRSWPAVFLRARQIYVLARFWISLTRGHDAPTLIYIIINV